MDRQSDRASVVGHGTSDLLAYPPCRVRGEFPAAPVLKAIDAFHQADVAFLNEIEQRKAAIQITLRDRDDEAEVRFDQAALRLVERVLPLAYPVRLFPRRQSRDDVVDDGRTNRQLSNDLRHLRVQPDGSQTLECVKH